jgi:D-glycero-D-manno-heptose 1,7-bisphosphate phosphatase
MNDLTNPKKLCIFDKDGCLVKSVVESKSGKSHAPNRLEDQEYFEDVRAVCENLRAEGWTLAVASNQGGVAFGIFSADEAELLVKSAAEYIGAVAYRVCFYHPKGKVSPWNQEHRNRKPQPGMLIELMQQFQVMPENTLMVGDWQSDKEAADAAGCDFRWAHEMFGRVNPFADRMHAALDVK